MLRGSLAVRTSRNCSTPLLEKPATTASSNCAANAASSTSSTTRHPLKRSHADCRAIPVNDIHQESRCLAARGAENETSALSTLEIPVRAGSVSDGRHAKAVVYASGSYGCVRQEMVEQLTSPLYWTASIRYMIEQGVQQFVEISPKEVLAGFNKRIDRSVSTTVISKPADIEQLLEGERGCST